MKNQNKKKRIIFVSSAFLVSILALIFVVINFRDNMVFFYSPSELKKTENLEKTYDRQIRVGGMIKKDSIVKIDALVTKFVITDFAETLEIEHIGILPDLFREKQGVVAKGIFDSKKNQFFSRELLVKHDEKYMPPEVAESIKKADKY